MIAKKTRPKKLATKQAPPKALSLGDLAKAINLEHEAVEQAGRTTIEHAVAVGELLVKAKAKCKHGIWLDWLDENCDFSVRTAQQYMRLTEIPKAQRIAHLTIADAVANWSGGTLSLEVKRIATNAGWRDRVEARGGSFDDDDDDEPQIRTAEELAALVDPDLVPTPVPSDARPDAPSDAPDDERMEPWEAGLAEYLRRLREACDNDAERLELIAALEAAVRSIKITLTKPEAVPA